MSLDASRWAWMQRIPKNDSASASAIKIVLLSMADRADENNLCFPSIKRLEGDTELNRKTIITAIGWLKKAGLLEDTGKRTGRTRQVIVYRLLGVDNREETVDKNSPKCGTVPESEPLEAPKNANSTENGTLTHSTPPNPPNIEGSKQSQMRNSTESGTVPYLDGNSPKYGTAKQSQIRDTEPTIIEPTKEPTTSTLCASLADASPNEFRRGEKISQWQPGQDAIEALEQFGVPAEFIAEQLQEFLFYWRDRDTNCASWDAKFYNRCYSQWKLIKHEWRSDHETIKSEQPNSKTPKAKPSSIDRANQRTREYLSEIEQHHCETPLGDGKALVAFDE